MTALRVHLSDGVAARLAAHVLTKHAPVAAVSGRAFALIGVAGVAGVSAQEAHSFALARFRYQFGQTMTSREFQDVADGLAAAES